MKRFTLTLGTGALLLALAVTSCGGSATAPSTAPSSAAASAASSAAASAPSSASAAAPSKPAASGPSSAAPTSASSSTSAAASAPAASGGSSASGSAAAKPGPRATVHFGGLGVSGGGLTEAPIYWGQTKGYFDQQGIDVDLQTFNSNTQMTPLLATGKLDAGDGGTNPGFYNGFAQGVIVKIV
ncbi:MAG: ABC transporter substrate-binding protein, partial [Chloroflexi bacterium]|nr:ABC transporter substrate-binding protein [Chloroflexota bacterium]